ncbi:rRNA maturation RNase YbeY [Taklimakanibacter deserti]|uniref:rRNA maturation RNase YbeY n=1 Tax=Taklimakanibacter deserti TaxID=2267839 RepID=UPI000E64A321
MIAAIDITDDAWARVTDLERLTERAIGAALEHAGADDNVEVSVLFASDAEAGRLNAEWRGKNYAPNILSFPAPQTQNVPEGEPRPLGDLILAVGTVAREAEEQGKPLTSHLTHLIVHGTLHLLGFDHIEERDARRMERAEIAILAGLGVKDPYNA